MIKLEGTEVFGWEPTIRGMRNPMNSWDKSDSDWISDIPEKGSIFVESDREGYEEFFIGPNDADLMMRLAKAGSVDAKYRRMIVVYVDILAPLYWWKEFDTYKVGTVANSCSTMHKIHSKEFTLEDFSCEHLINSPGSAKACFQYTIDALNMYRQFYLESKDKLFWWQMIQLLPSSYNQRRTVMLNYEVLHNIYIHRKDHKLDEWREFCEWIKKLPYSEIITLGNVNYEAKWREWNTFPPAKQESEK